MATSPHSVLLVLIQGEMRDNLHKLNVLPKMSFTNLSCSKLIKKKKVRKNMCHTSKWGGPAYSENYNLKS